MDNLIINATKSSPYVCFDATTGVLNMKGKSYPENAAQFYTPILAWLREYLRGVGEKQTVVNLEMIYLNSSSSKALFNFFDLLENFAKDGRNIVVNWHYHPDNDAAFECGEEFREDLSALAFNLVESSEELEI